MQFKYPEILYALLLLLIPIFIHLFQLRRFEKVAFTNVAFLKKVELQTRKSSKLKKFLILLSRLGLLAALILAFAQPYVSSNKQNLKPKTVLYIDNSLSMQAKNGTNELFKNAIQDIISNTSIDTELTVLTNDDIYTDLDAKDLKNQLLSLNYSPFSRDLNTTLLQANKSFKTDKNYRKHLVLVSDFQSKDIHKKLLLNDDIKYSFVQLLPQNKQNISIDSVYVAKQTGLNIDLDVVLKSYGISNENLSVSLFKNDILVGKTSCELAKNKTKIVRFKIPFSESFNGRISIDDDLIDFDDELFFSINKLEKINVLAIGNDNKFLTKIYTNPEFNLLSKKPNQVDYNVISKQHLIVLNELKSIPLSLQKTLKEFVVNGGSLVVIPSQEISIDNYNTFFTALKIGSISKKQKVDYLVNSINFSHPLLANVFEKKIKNFQYPNVKSVYNTIFNNSNTILKFNNNQAFILENKIKKAKVYWLASSINQKNSNFKSSPLIVPVFYNFAKQSYNLPSLYYDIGKSNKITVNTSITNDAILHIVQNNTDNKFIPLQQVMQEKVILTVDDNPLKSGFYTVKKNNKSIKNIAFNYNRLESETKYANIEKSIKNHSNVSFSNDIKLTFDKIDSQYKMTSYWKWFLILALLFFIIEMLFVKFLKK